MTSQRVERPWAALWALVLGFFMILVDTTIVSVAGPAIMQAFGANLTETLWVTSAYLLAYAVPLLVTGRLGDRFGPKRVYLSGLALFTVASLACGVSPTIGVLVAARVLQGFGASMMTPQTMAVITRIFAPNARGAAMGLWGGVAGVATLLGPILGGLLIDGFGWEWIFIINVPVGIIAFMLAMKYVPSLEKNFHRFDILGVVLSAVGMFLLVFGVQEGETFGWGQIWGPVTVWGCIISGVAIMVAFVVWQRLQRGEPLLPLVIFRDWNFSLGTGAIATMGFAITAMSLPTMFYFQLVRGFTPTESALLFAPMAVLSGVLAPFVGKLIDRRDPRPFATAGTLSLVVGFLVYIFAMHADAPVWVLLIASAFMGLANAAVWGPLATMSTYGLSPKVAGAGSGAYNTSRQVGAVLGSATIAAAMNALIIQYLGVSGGRDVQDFQESLNPGAEVTVLPDALSGGFAEAMANSLVLPAAVIAVGTVLTLFFRDNRRRKAPNE